MSLFRRYSAAPLAAAVLLLGACAGGTEVTPVAPDLDQGPLFFNISPNWVTFLKEPEGPIPTEDQWFNITGLIAIGGYPQFGAIQYDPDSESDLNGLFILHTEPNFQRDPLAWRFHVSLNQTIAAGLPEGGYFTAQVPVTVGGALNNPQWLMLVYDTCGFCLFADQSRMGELDLDDPTFNRYEAGTEDEDDTSVYEFFYELWRVFVPPGTWYVQMRGDDYQNCYIDPVGTVSDPYLYLYETDNETLIDSDDDSCGYWSEIQINNFTGMTQEYLIRATHYDPDFDDEDEDYKLLGTYELRLTSESFDDGEPSLRAEPLAPLVKRGGNR